MIMIGDWRVEQDTCVLVNDEQSIRISARSMDVLVYLAERQGRAVSADELIEKYWQSDATTDHAVHKVIASLRRVLKDSAQDPKYIKTLPKRGYTLIAEVKFPEQQQVEPPATASENLQAAPPQALRPWPRLSAAYIAVFSCLAITLVLFAATELRDDPAPSSATRPARLAIFPPHTAGELPDKQQRQLQQLLHRLSTRLSELPSIELLAAGLTAGLGTASAQEADHALTTTTYEVAGQLQSFVNLLRLEDGVNLYSRRFNLADATSGSEDQAVADIVSAVSIYLDKSEYEQMRQLGTKDPIAYEHFRKGRYYSSQYNHRDWHLAMKHYQEAIDEDPNFINAYLGMAKAAQRMAVYSREARVEEISRSVLQLSRQLAIAVPNSSAQDTLKSIRMSLESSNHWEQERHYREQIQRGDAAGSVYAFYALYLIGARLYWEAEQFLELAQQQPADAISLNEAWNFGTQTLAPDELAHVKSQQLLDRPAHIGILGTAVSAYAFTGEYDRALRYYQEQRELDTDGVRAHLSEIILALSSGQLSKADLSQVASEPEGLAALGRFSALLQPETLEDPDLAFNNGVLGLMLGNMEMAAHHWRNLTRIDKRKLHTRLHALEIFFPRHVLQDAAYGALLEELGAGKSWQRQLMEGVKAMSSVTGVKLSPESQAAYESGSLMLYNNTWAMQKELSPRSFHLLKH